MAKRFIQKPYLTISNLEPRTKNIYVYMYIYTFDFYLKRVILRGMGRF